MKTQELSVAIDIGDKRITKKWGTCTLTYNHIYMKVESSALMFDINGLKNNTNEYSGAATVTKKTVFNENYKHAAEQKSYGKANFKVDPAAEFGAERVSKSENAQGKNDAFEFTADDHIAPVWSLNKACDKSPEWVLNKHKLSAALFSELKDVTLLAESLKTTTHLEELEAIIYTATGGYNLNMDYKEPLIRLPGNPSSGSMIRRLTSYNLHKKVVTERVHLQIKFRF